MRPARRRSIRAACAAGSIALAAVVVGGCDTGGLPTSVTTQGDEVTSTWKIFLYLAIAVAGLVWVLTAYVILSSIRRRKAAEAAAAANGDGVALPRQHQYNTKLEIVYTALPLLLVIALLAIALQSTSVLTDTSKPADVNIHVIGFQWQWQFQYFDQNKMEQPYVIIAGDPETPPTLMLPVGRNVLFTLASNDVAHAFWVPEFLEKRDLIPGIDNPPNRIAVFVKSTGEWTGRCAEYCGINHWLMVFNVKAVPADEYDAWVTKARTQPQPLVSGGATTTTLPPGTHPVSNTTTTTFPSSTSTTTAPATSTTPGPRP